MNSFNFRMAHPRLGSAHWPVPLTAAGTAQACPICLAFPSNQRTWLGDFRLYRPIERAVRSASVPSQIGGSTLSRPALVMPRRRNIVPNALNHGHCSGRRALRFLGPSAIADAVIQCSFLESSGSIRPFFPSSLLPKRRLRVKRKGVGICFDFSRGVIGKRFRDFLDNPARLIGLSYLRGHFPGSNDRQDSTFSRKKFGRAAVAPFPAVPAHVRHASEGIPFSTPPTKQP